MPYPQLDRSRLQFKPLEERQSKTALEAIAADPGAPAPPLRHGGEWIEPLVRRILGARAEGRTVALAYGAHLLKNGMAPVLIRMMEMGFVTHLATNGAGVIHDWEFAYHGRSEEDVRRYAAEGQFGLWRETGFYLNAAILAGAVAGMGLGEAVGAAIERGSIALPGRAELRRRLAAISSGGEADSSAPAAAEALLAIDAGEAPEGPIAVEHPHKRHSVVAAAWRLGLPLTSHPGIGYDIIHAHPLARGAALGLAAMRDFLSLAHSISRLSGGAFLSVGSAIMAPMTFEKSLSMARNLARQEGRRIDDFSIVVNDIQPGAWDWTKGEPPKDNPAYYLRFCKSFSRMGGEFRYACEDNRAFLLNLFARLVRERPAGFPHRESERGAPGPSPA